MSGVLGFPRHYPRLITTIGLCTGVKLGGGDLMCCPNCGHQVPLDKALLHQGNCLFVLSVALALMVGLSSNLVFGSSPPAKKRSKLDRNITAIGQRGLGGGKSLGNWYSLEKEKEIGQQMSASLERSVTILSDAKTTSYVDRLAHRIAQNSDARMPVTVRVIDTQEAYALSLAGGYQYLTRDSSCELAAKASWRARSHVGLLTPRYGQPRRNTPRRHPASGFDSPGVRGSERAHFQYC